MNCIKSPCTDCPFRKDSLRGWLADYTPEELYNIVLNEQPFPCHMAMKKTDYVEPKEVGNEEYPICAGSLRFMKKSGKLPRNKELALLLKQIAVEDCENILSQIEFITHHKPFLK